MTADHVNLVVDIVSRLGLPIVLILVILWVAIKHIIPMWKASKEAEQRSFEERNRTYAEQTRTIIQVAEQGNTIAKQCSAVIELNSEVIKSNTEAHRDEQESRKREIEEIREVGCALKDHEKIASGIHTDVKRILDQVLGS